MNHLWQRFLLASALVVGLAIGVAATIFGFDNRTPVDVYWTTFHIHRIPLWSVAVIPLALFLVAGTLFHWLNGLHHFTEHMRHRRRVHELEAELASVRAHLDRVLEMPAVATGKQMERKESVASPTAAGVVVDDLAPAEPEPPVAEAAQTADLPQAPADGTKRSRKRATLEAGDPKPDGTESHVEGMVGDGTPAEPEDAPEPEA